MTKLRLLSVLVVTAGVAGACADADRPSSPSGGSGTGGESGSSPVGGSGATHAGGAGDGASGGTGSAIGGEAGGGNLGGAAAGTGAGGESGMDGEVAAGGTGEIFPPVGPTPVCATGVLWGTGTRLALSGAGDQVLQAVTSDELSIAWKSADTFYVADRAQTGDPFGSPLPVASSDQYNAVTLSADGLRLVAVTKDLRVLEQARQPGMPFDEAQPGEGAFTKFNSAILGDPSPGKVLEDAVLSADGASFFYSYFLMDVSGAAPTESRLSDGSFNLAGLSLGAPLQGDADGNRRIPTGLASDTLTLFYRDDVEGDFRAAWRVNRDVPFEASEVVSPAAGTVAAAPNADCSMLYFSAPGTEGIDLFVSARQ